MKLPVKTLARLSFAFAIAAFVSAFIFFAGNNRQLSDAALVFCIRFLAWAGLGSLCMSLFGIFTVLLERIVLKKRKLSAIFTFSFSAVFGIFFTIIALLLDSYISGLSI
ncbi:hypothetical protein MASR2M29_13770 [Spirochaetota bacterium]